MPKGSLNKRGGKRKRPCFSTRIGPGKGNPLPGPVSLPVSAQRLPLSSRGNRLSRNTSRANPNRKKDSKTAGDSEMEHSVRYIGRKVQKARCSALPHRNAGSMPILAFSIPTFVGGPGFGVRVPSTSTFSRHRESGSAHGVTKFRPAPSLLFQCRGSGSHGRLPRRPWRC